MQPIITERSPQLQRILGAHHVKRAYAFGSVCTDDFHDNSDIDLLIAFDREGPFQGYVENMWSLEDALEQLFQRPVDILTEAQLTNPYFIENINSSKTPVYEQ
jgi:predicted nucleotidyltransferase